MRHELDSQKKLNMEEFEEDDVEAQRRYAGVRPGAYCRVKLSAVPCEFVKVLTQFTCFTRTKVQILTAEELRSLWGPPCLASRQALCSSLCLL